MSTSVSSTTNPRWASLPTVAEHLGVAEKTVRRLIADGTLTGYRIGPRLIRVDLNDVDALFDRIPATTAVPPRGEGGRFTGGPAIPTSRPVDAQAVAQ